MNDRQQLLQRARVWRIANKPYFDAIYGSEQGHDWMRTERARGIIFARAWRERRAAADGRGRDEAAFTRPHVGAATPAPTTERVPLRGMHRQHGTSFATVLGAAGRADRRRPRRRSVAGDGHRPRHRRARAVCLGRPPVRKDPVMSATVAADELRLLLERAERLEEEKKGINDDIKDVFAEAKARGYDVKTMRQIMRLRKMEKHHREEAEMLLETYLAALGMK